jgi:hypothetical protein
MFSIFSNNYINKKRQSNAWKTVAVVACHRQLAFQIHQDFSAQSFSFARFFRVSSSIMMLQERDFNMNVTSKWRKKRSIKVYKLIASSWELEFRSSIQLEKCQVELKFFEKSVESNWEVELKHSSRIEKLDSITWLKNSIRFNKILDTCK